VQGSIITARDIARIITLRGITDIPRRRIAIRIDQLDFPAE
jgi:hypothetical protein